MCGESGKAESVSVNGDAHILFYKFDDLVEKAVLFLCGTARRHSKRRIGSVYQTHCDTGNLIVWQGDIKTLLDEAKCPLSNFVFKGVVLLQVVGQRGRNVYVIAHALDGKLNMIRHGDFNIAARRLQVTVCGQIIDKA